MTVDRVRAEARRAAAKRHHPDAGGCAADFVAALAEIDGRAELSVTTRTSAAHRRTAAMRRWWRRRSTRHYFTLPD